jgi:hypothetical protein
VASPEVENCVEETDNCETVTASLLVLVSVAVCSVFCPIGAVGKEIIAGEICTTSCGVGFAELLVKPAQPVSSQLAAAIAAIDEADRKIFPALFQVPALPFPTTAKSLAIPAPSAPVFCVQTRASQRVKNTGETFN